MLPEGVPAAPGLGGDRGAPARAGRRREGDTARVGHPLPTGAPQQHFEKPAAHKQPLPTPLSLLPVITALLETPLDIRLGGSASLSWPHFLALKSGSDAKSRVDVTLFIILHSYSQGYPVISKPTSRLPFRL